MQTQFRLVHQQHIRTFAGASVARWISGRAARGLLPVLGALCEEPQRDPEQGSKRSAPLKLERKTRRIRRASSDESMPLSEEVLDDVDGIGLPWLEAYFEVGEHSAKPFVERL